MKAEGQHKRTPDTLSCNSITLTVFKYFHYSTFLLCLTQQLAWAGALISTLEDKVLFSDLSLCGTAGKP